MGTSAANRASYCRPFNRSTPLLREREKPSSKAVRSAETLKHSEKVAVTKGSATGLFEICILDDCVFSA
jgi:hypothetical protein